MSSSMLEQAVIDAQALKEAAIKNAEQEVLEKYAGEIKEAVDVLLEQEPDPLAMDPMAAGGMADPMAGGAVGELDPITDEVPLKATDGEEACPCPEEGEEIELDLDALKKAIASAEDEEMELSAAGEEVVVEPEMMYEVSNSDLESLLEEEETKPDYIDLDKDGDKEELDEEIELDEETLTNTIAELLKVDLKNVPRGMLGTTHPTETEQIYAVDVALAAEQDTAIKEKSQEWLGALKKIEKLEEQVKSLKSEKNRLVKEHNELKSVARQVSDKLTELNTSNAKLVYQNRILESHSLNERQKEKLVEAVSNANSTEEAKVIFETLQDSLTSKEKRSPQNLREAVSKNNRLVLKSNKKETQVTENAAERMKKLAGII